MSDLIDRQAVIDLLKQMRKDGNMVPWEGKDVFARIRKLPTIQPEKEQLSCEGTTKGTTSDLISRQAARHALCKAVHKGEDIPCENQTASCLWTGTRVCDFVREIDALPSVQPERKRGRWLPDNNSVYEMRFICSECKESEVVPTIGFTKYKPIWDFCPNCGADMRGEKDG